MLTKVAVIGAGIIGLSTAYKILEDVPNCEVTVFYESCSPYTTGDLSAGFVFPYLQGAGKIKEWLQQTVNHLSGLHKLPNSYEIGVRPSSGYIFENAADDFCFSLPFFERLTEKEKSLFLTISDGWKVTTWSCDCTKYLPWMTMKIKALGGTFVNRRINSFDELKHFDVIVNCAGISAKQLTNDDKLVPVRGQVFIVKAPWLKNAIMKGSYYILPRLDDVVLGGTKQKGDYNLEVSAEDGERIWKECCELDPSVKYAEVISQKVGLRPYRDPIRLEIETLKLNGRSVPVLHNYGHSGAGVTLHWGCAIEASQLLQTHLKILKHKL